MSDKLACFDMDGVIFKDINFWMELHKAFGTYEKGKVLTDTYLRTDYGKLVEEVVVNLWQGLPASVFYDLVDSAVYNHGAKNFFTFLADNDYTTAIISASSLDLAKRAQSDLGVDFVFANNLVIQNDKVSGEFHWPVGVGGENKANIVRDLAKKLGVVLSKVIYVGDNLNDIEAFKIVGTPIAFNSNKAALKKHAKHVVDSDDLTELTRYF